MVSPTWCGMQFPGSSYRQSNNADICIFARISAYIKGNTSNSLFVFQKCVVTSGRNGPRRWQLWKQCSSDELRSTVKHRYGVRGRHSTEGMHMHLGIFMWHIFLWIKYRLTFCIRLMRFTQPSWILKVRSKKVRSTTWYFVALAHYLLFCVTVLLIYFV